MIPIGVRYSYSHLYIINIDIHICLMLVMCLWCSNWLCNILNCLWCYLCCVHLIVFGASVYMLIWLNIRHLDNKYKNN